MTVRYIAMMKNPEIFRQFENKWIAGQKADITENLRILDGMYELAKIRALLRGKSVGRNRKKHPHSEHIESCFENFLKKFAVGLDGNPRLTDFWGQAVLLYGEPRMTHATLMLRWSWMPRNPSRFYV